MEKEGEKNSGNLESPQTGKESHEQTWQSQSKETILLLTHT